MLKYPAQFNVINLGAGLLLWPANGRWGECFRSLLENVFEFSLLMLVAQKRTHFTM